MNFGSFKNIFAIITSLSECYFRFKIFILLVHMKKVISMIYGSSKSSWKPWRWVRFDLKFTMKDIYINSNLNPLTKFASSSRSIEFKDILPWNISQMITKTVPSSERIVISYVMKWGIPFWVWQEIKGNWHSHMIRISQRKATVEQILVLEEREKSKKAGLWQSQSEIEVGKLTYDRKIITEFTRSISSSMIG